MMPVVATFDGIKIMFYNDEHPPPHFHAKNAEHEAMIDIESLDVLQGFLPLPKLRKAKAWATGRRQALLFAWLACRSELPPGKIA
jgi:hypothetical protein